MASSYKHKSGALKRKLQKEKLEQSAKGRQDIKKFFKRNEQEELQEFQPAFMAEPTSAPQTKPSSNQDASTPTVGLSQGGNDKCAGADPNLSKDTDDGSKTPATQTHPSSIQDGSTPTVGLCQASNDKCAGADPSLSKDTVDDNKTCNFDDPSTWPPVMSDKLRQEIISCYGGFSAFQASSKSFPADPSGKHFPETLLYMKTENRACKPILRDWLMWSETKNSIHCLPCSIFYSNQNKSKLAKEGFSPEKQPYKRLYKILSKHERSSDHRKHYLEWKSLQISLKGHGVDSNLQQIINCEATRWKAILQRILDTTLFLTSRGLAFQGENTQIGDVHNGNFLGVLELLGKYDEVIREHLAKIKENQLNKKSMIGQAHYLSWYSQNEFISLCGKKLLKTILHQREESVFYGIIVDATPDISHQEQNVLILRYVFQNEEKNTFEVCERFIEFMNFNGKTGEVITDELLSTLDNIGVPLSDCRAQGYDNGSNMRGHTKGVQSRILEKNPSAIFSPCGAHSLNRVGVNAAKLNHDVLTFFGNIDSFYSLFSSSPGRWELLKQHVPLSLQSLSETRWSERIQAVRPIVKHYPSILRVLDLLLEENDLPALTPAARNIALALKRYFGSFKGLLTSSFWHKILASIDQRNQIIQRKGISLNTETQLIKDLLSELQALRDSWETILNEAKHVAEAVGIIPEFPLKRKSSVPESTPEQLQQQASQDFKSSVVFPVLDFIMADLKTRFASCKEICELFAPVLAFMDLDKEELKLKSANLVAYYPSDFADSEALFEETLHMKNVFVTVFHSEKDPLKLLNSINEKNLQPIFLNFCTAIKLFCIIPVTVSTAERSFSRLSNSLKTWQRSTTGQTRLNHLAILAIENELAKTVDFSDVITEFSEKKARKVILK